MSFAFTRDKALPDIPVDIDVGAAAAEYDAHWPQPSPKPMSANAHKVLPSINVERTLSGEEMHRLHDLWNGAALSARAHRRRQHSQNCAPRRIPDPISIPEPENVPPALPSANPSITSTTPSTAGTRKRWGFLSARTFPETQEREKKIPNALELLRAKAQERLKKKLRYTKSTPNLSDKALPRVQEGAVQPALPSPVEAAPTEVEGVPSSPGKSATPEEVHSPEDMDENAIYFTIDPNWRASQGSVQFQFITPIPESPGPLGRSDSPLLHRHHSLDQLWFAAEKAAQASTAMGSPEVHENDVAPHPIDELHSYLEL